MFIIIYNNFHNNLYDSIRLQEVLVLIVITLIQHHSQPLAFNHQQTRSSFRKQAVDYIKNENTICDRYLSNGTPASRHNKPF